MGVAVGATVGVAVGFAVGDADALAVGVQRKIAEEASHALEAQLRHAQKMEAVGRLAGGIAHDFNNVLSVVLGYAEMVLGDLKVGDPLRDDVNEIHKAAKRAAGLTQQLLMFSRRQVIAPKVLDLNEVLSGMAKMLQRLVGEDVELVSVPGAASQWAGTPPAVTSCTSTSSGTG